MSHPLVIPALCLLLASAIMALTWLLARRLDCYSLVDPIWSFGFTPIVALQAALGNGSPRRRIAILILVALWSLRLGTHLMARWRRHFPHEDVRYGRLREEWGPRAPAKMFGFFQLQGALQVVLAVPFLITCLDPRPPVGPWGFRPLEWAGICIWFAGIVGESVSDRQLAAFRADPANKGRVCRRGVWNYSRHPNYFFEWLVWVGYAVFAFGAPYGVLGLVAPLAMWHFLVNVTGIPMTEDLSVKSKGDAYREYQRTTSAFVPWFPGS